MGFWRTRAKNDLPNEERRIETLFLVKHKKKIPEPNFEVRIDERNPEQTKPNI